MSDIIKVPTVPIADIAPAADATTRRDTLLLDAAEVTTITNKLDADCALITLRSITAYRDEVESARKLVKAPFKALVEKIDSVASDLLSRLQAERDRIALLLGSYEDKERAKAEEAQARAREQAAQIARDAERKAMDAARQAPDQETRDRAVDAVVEQSQAKLAEVEQIAINAQRPKAQGTTLRSNICFEVTDAAALYAAYPELCTIEPNKTAIKAILKTNPNLQVPGLKHWVEKKLSA